jgi:hypothetical protein
MNICFLYQGILCQTILCQRVVVHRASHMALLLCLAPCLWLVVAGGQVSAQARTMPTVSPPEWVRHITRMTFITPGEVDLAAASGAQAVHFNLVWPYYPLQRDGGGLSRDEDRQLRDFVTRCHARGLRALLGLPPFPPVALLRVHPDWRIDPDGSGKADTVTPQENDLGTRLGCNSGPWGDYLIDVLAELAHDYHLDGFSFDGNYHPALCYCPACRQQYRHDTGKELPPTANLDDIAYRRYLVWRGERMEEHYRRMQARLKAISPQIVLMSWSANAGRYGHLLSTPRPMPATVNRLFDLPMQEWWLDETNLGGSVAPAFGAAYLRALSGDGPCASEPYMMSRGNPYGTDSFPVQERLLRSMLALTNGSVSAESLGWSGHRDSAKRVFTEVAKRAPWLVGTQRLPWAAMLVSEQTRQFYAYRNIPELFLPHVYGGFRAAFEEHVPLDLICDWDITPQSLSRYRVLFLPNAAALSDAQVEAIRAWVRGGGGLVATCETSLYDELGRPRPDFALADLFQAAYLGPNAATPHALHPALDANFARALTPEYWRDRNGAATLTWDQSPSLLDDARLTALVPQRSVTFRGPRVRVRPLSGAEVIAHLLPEGETGPPLPAILAHPYGSGRVVYMAAGIDAALWSYAYPYERRLLARALAWAAGEAHAPPISVNAPMAVQATYFTQQTGKGRRVIVHLWNGINSAADHGLPATEVPLREETVAVSGIRVTWNGLPVLRAHAEPGGVALPIQHQGNRSSVSVPPLDMHTLIVLELSSHP